MLDKKKSICGYEFEDSTLFDLALTHRSASSQNNERLEFLGDSLLGLIVSIKIMEKFPNSSEGELTRIRASLVNGDSLSDMANQLGIGENPRRSRVCSKVLTVRPASLAQVAKASISCPLLVAFEPSGR